MSNPFLLLAYIAAGTIQAAIAFAHPSPSAAAASTSSAIQGIDTHPTSPQLSVDRVKERVQSGRVYVQDDFLTESQMKLLQKDMQQLDQEGKFVVNGLSDVRKGLKGETSASESNTAEANQGFDVKYDRSVCPIPWWQDSLSLIDAGAEECSNDAGEEAATLHSIQRKLQILRKDLANILERPTMLDSSLGHECYYSKSSPGSSLARHMDERHEESKGPRGWLLPSRRSLSWLIYLSETQETNDGDNQQQENANQNKAWDAKQNGGLLRTFPQRYFRPSGEIGWVETVQCGSHNGNLQVGWLLPTTTYSLDKGYSNRSLVTHPVFLDCWHQYMNPYTSELEPHNVLYTVSEPVGENANKDNNDKQYINYITAPWMPDAVGGNVLEFLQKRALLESHPDHTAERLFLSQYASEFRLLEDREAWNRGEDPDGSLVEDILPKRGRLVVFDSVTLPHEVTAVIKGSRSALAGWFHEETQPLGG